MAMRDDDKLVRQLSLIAFLMAQQRPVTADEIHEAVEGYGGMSEQAFLRRFYADRAEIESKGISLAVERPSDDPFQGDLYALPPENYYLPALDFDEAELSALQTCLYLLEGQFAYAEPLRLALQHLTLGRPSPLDDHAARTVSVNLLGGDYSPDVAAHLTKIESAISRRKTVRFTYYSIGRDETGRPRGRPLQPDLLGRELVRRGLRARARGRPPLSSLAHQGPCHLQDARRTRLPAAAGAGPVSVSGPGAVAARRPGRLRHHRAQPDDRVVGRADVRHLRRRRDRRRRLGALHDPVCERVPTRRVGAQPGSRGGGRRPTRGAHRRGRRPASDPGAPPRGGHRRDADATGDG